MKCDNIRVKRKMPNTNREMMSSSSNDVHKKHNLLDTDGRYIEQEIQPIRSRGVSSLDPQGPKKCLTVNNISLLR